MRKSLVGLFVAALTIPTVAAAQTPEQPWLVRTRALYIVPTGSESDVLGAKVGPDLTFEVDISRRFGSIFAAELVLATAGHEVYIEDTEAGRVSLGSVNILPPSLVLQAHLPTNGKIKPYIGAGVNMTIFYNKTGVLETPSLAGLGDEAELSTSFGYVGQLGVDVAITPRAVFNIDAKYVKLNTDLSVDGNDVDTVDVNPILIGVGFGYRF